MLQNNFHFLFPQIYFGDNSDDLSDLEDDEINLDNSCILSFIQNGQPQNIGLYMNLSDQLIDWPEPDF